MLTKIVRLEQVDRSQGAPHLRPARRPLPRQLRHRTASLIKSAKTLKLLTGTGLDHYEMNAVVSTLNFILANAVMFQVSDAVLNKELLDLGLPKENVESIAKAYRASRDKLIEASLERAVSSSPVLTQFPATSSSATRCTSWWAARRWAGGAATASPSASWPSRARAASGAGWWCARSSWTS